ncbi:PREDICTED: uncharacterized protein LOC109210912 [Nicotiana attenuata]|uniref:uncharacterized protein LOC109210912 n=1 Tax=Nicotiana attenuata TaxID=49451 RepID=UPI0009053F0C|nr:PREDICTED: uncharacterized protein LOC109210912 [Nicotiana attenuata]
MAIGDEIPAGTCTNTAAAIIDHHHPLFLQPSDTPGSSLISIQLTGSENYAICSRFMKIGLTGKSKLGFVDGRCTKDKFDRSLHELWEKCNAIVLSWIMNAVSKELLSGIVYKSSAHKVWTDLKDKYDKVDGSRIFFLHKEIATLSQGISSVSTYFSRLTDLWEEYDALMPCPGCDCPESKSYSEHFEYQKLLQFLMGLNETYAQARSQILMMSPIPSVNKAYFMAVSEESQRKMGKPTQTLDMGDSTALFTNKGGMITGNAYKPRRSNLFCDYCNYKGHTRETCYKIHGYPSDFKMRRKANNFPQRPMVNNTIREGQQPQHMGKAIANAVSQEGQQMQNSPVGLTTPTLPQPVMFTQEQYDQILKLLNKDTSDNSQHFAGTTKATTLADKTKDENWIVDSGATNHMVHTKKLLDKINTKSLKSQSKVHLPDGTSLDVVCTGESRIGECGVIRNDLHNGKVKLIGKELEGLYNLQHKQDKAAAAAVRSHGHFRVEEDLGIWHGRLGHVPDKFGATMKILRSDNGTEFFNSECSNLFQSYGMIYLSSCVHTPQQNGVVERKHRHILEVARAIRLQGHLPLKFWGECIHATVYIINRIPLSVLSGKSSFQLMYGRAPSLQHLRVIGRLCFAKVLVGGDKLGARAIGAVHMGYSSSQKGYKLYNLLTNSFFVSRDVKFMENIFPFQLLKEGKLQVFPNGVITPVPSNDTTLPSTVADPPHAATTPSSTDEVPHEPVPHDPVHDADSPSPGFEAP